MVQVVRVYNNGDRRVFNLTPSEAEEHLGYSVPTRFGCAHFKDGECVSRGYLSQERCDAISEELKASIASSKR